MPVLMGIVLALASGALVRLARLDRDRACYPILLIVIAAYYVLFAATGGAPADVWAESIAATVFVTVAIAGFHSSLWWVAAALAGHGVFDSVHQRLIANPGVPAWWPTFCGTFDVVLAGILAGLLRLRAIPVRRASSPSTLGSR